jgi:hypothetical protein
MTVHHDPKCATRRNPAWKGRASRYLISAAFPVPGADGSEVEVAHRTRQVG